jgi:hypothetical protein
MMTHSDAVLMVSQWGTTSGSSRYLRISASVGSRTSGPSMIVAAPTIWT